MKIDRGRLKKSTTEVPLECRELIDRLRGLSKHQLLDELSKVTTWIFGKCELFHWADILDEFDTILGDAAASAPNNKWALACDISFTNSEKKLLLWVLHFTTLLIEHSFSRHMYNSMEHLLTLLGSNDMSVVLSVLNLLYMFSKRSNFITRLPTDKRSNLVARLTLLAESWGGKESGFGLADCCSIDRPVPPSATTLHFEYHREQSNGKDMKNKHNIEYIHIENVDELRKNPAEIMFGLLGMYSIPADKEMALFTHVRLAYRFNHYGHRVLCVLARLQALSVLVYSNAIQDNAHSLLYSGLLEELVELVELKFPYLVEIRAAALRTLTSIIHLDRNPHFPKRPGSRLSSIIEVTGANQYHGFLPVLVRHCISSLIRQIPTWETYLADVEKKRLEKQAGNDPLTTKDAATSPMYAIYDSRRSLEDTDYDSYSDSESDGDDIHSPPFIPTVADREPSPEPENPSKYLERMRDAFQDNEFKTEYPLPLATALFSFLYHLASYEAGGDALVSCGMMESLLHVVNWHGIELEHITFVTRAVRVIDLITNIDMQAFHTHGGLQSFITRLEIEIEQCRRDQLYEFKVHEPMEGGPSEPPQELPSFDFTYHANNVGKSCLPQRAALLKSMLNFMKKALQDTTFAESIRHLMEGTLPSSLKHIILNAEYYGPSLFLLATDVVTVYVFQEPSLLSTLQDNGLTDVVLYALLIKDVPATREVLSSLPNVFSALCLNTRGLNAFVKCKPFDRLFKVLLSSNYLNAMRRRRSSDPLGDTASNLGNAMDELIRHQPSLKVDATAAIIKLLNELCTLGTDPKYICWRPHNKSDLSPTNSSTQTSNNEASSDEEDDDEDEPSSSSQQQTTVDQAPTVNERIPIALVDYILNVMKFIDAILSNNSTDDHCKEFVNQGGLVPLLKILGLPNLPVDCPVTTSSQSVASVCKSILNLSQEPKVLKQGMKQLNEVLQVLKPLYTRKPNFIGSKLLQELTDNAKLDTAFSTASATPLLHAMGAAHGYVHMFVHVCRTGQNDIRNLSLQHWGSVEGIVVLEGLAELYTALVWESTLLLALCSDDVIPSDCDFGKEEMEKLSAAFADSSGCSTPACSTPVHTADNAGSVTSALEALSTNMSVDSEGEIPSSKPTTQQLAYIKPLLGASSRLGRALAELFGLLVKLCVGSPVRQRRGQNVVSSPQVPNVHARNVATALNKLLANGLSADHLPPSPVPKFRLTFLICSVGFTSPMLFDEKRYPYHLMLQKFVAMGGQATFFATFKWALTAGGTYPLDMLKPDWNVPDGTGEFLDVWLTLLEKMVNPKAILESPHVIATKASADGTSKQSGFDPMKYLIKIHKSAFKAVMCLWGRKPLPNYGERMTDSMLSILKHILRGEKLIKERLHKTDDSKSEATASTSTAAGPSTVRPPAADVDPENLRQLMDMGFCREYALEALLHTLNIEQATEYLLANARPAQAGMEVDDEDDQVMTAICISILAQSTPGSSGERDDAAASSSTASEAKAKETKSKQDEEDDDEDDDDDETPLADSYIDAFTESAVDICLVLIEQIPECVYKVCDLLVTVMKRNGEAFRDQMLDRILMEIHYTLSVILGKYEGRPASMEMYEDLVFAVKAYQLGYYTHLYTLFFEVPVYFDMRVPCGFAVHRAGLLNDLLRLVSLAETLMTELRESHEPKWLAPVLLLTDSLCKVATCTQRKREMHLVTSRLWKWYDLVTGKWTPYSTSNYRLINDAYWNGEQTVRVTFGRRRYTVNFNNMEMYDEGGNKKPITMRLLNSIFDYCTDVTKPVPDDAEDKRVPLTEKEEKRCIPFPSITTSQVHTIIRCCVHLMNLKIDKDLLHAILRVCVRLTRDFENAKLFVHLGGVNCLLNMRQSSMFSGFEILVTILIRHTLEEPAVLAYAMEKVIRCRTGVSIPPPYKDLIYMIRQIGAAVTRDPTTFYQVARNILRIDTSIYRRSFVFTADEVDSRLPIRAEPNTRQHVPNLDEEVSVEVIYDLLYALLQPLEYDSSDYPEVNKTTVPPNPQPSTSKANTESMSHRASNLLNTTGNDDNILETAEDTKNASTTTYTKEFSEEEKSRKPLISKHIIVKMLADAVVSYGSVAKLITEFSYKSGVASVIKEDCTALAYVFDKLLPITENQSDRNTSNMARLLIAAIASCNHQPDAQSTLVSEVKAALNRALMLPESPEKHSQIQLICGIISTMIDNCPKSQIKVKTQSVNINNMVRLMLRKGIMNDLARVPHCLDLSSPNFSYTINAALKPMDSLSLIVNQPLGIVSMAKNKRSQQSNINDVSTQSATSTEATNAQGEEATEDTENTEQDVSAVASSLEVNPSIQNVDDTQSMLDMMDQILERTVNENSGSGRIRPGMDLDDDGNLTYDRDATEELMSTDSGDTESNASDQDGQDDDNDDNDGDDDDMDEVNDNDDNNSDDELNRTYTMDRDEDILMIQYAEHDHDTDDDLLVRRNENGYNFALFDEAGTSTEQSGSGTITHPLLTFRHNAETNSSAQRAPRGNRSRRYQYVQVNSRAPQNPPAILQRLLCRLLGPNAVQTSLGPAQILTPSAVFDSPRVLFMEDLNLATLSEEEINFVELDQSGFYFGPTVAATINHVTSVLYWWTEESKLLDLESTIDCTTIVCNRLVPVLMRHRNEELLERKKKKQLEDEKNKDKKQDSQQDEKGPIEYADVNPAALYEAVINEATATAFNEASNEDPLQNTGQRSSPSVFYEESGLDANIVSADQQAEENAAIESVVIEPTPTHNVQETQTQTQSEAETETEVVAEPQTEAPREERDVTMGESSRTVTEEIPEGVDPSFLEALPPDMRSEVLEQHRILRLQQRMSAAVSEQQAAETSAAGTSTAVSPEFLAALPPALQEEVLTQQRLEQQRQAAARANPNEPVDAGAFFETLQPSLRTIILSDMEDSQMSALPPDLAAEAQNLRRDWEARNRQYQQERFLQTNLPNIMRHTSRGRMATRFTNFIPQRGQWASLRDVIYSDPMGGNSRIRGRQLLDHEALSCLLLLLFTDSPHLNKLTLHKVLRNLCYHGPTRDWVIKALLGIIDKSVSVLPEDPFNKPPKKSLRPGPLTSKLVTDLRLVGNGANWLNIRMEAALGCQATVFTVHRSGGKRSDKSPSSISIHPQAAPIVCRNALDLFITLSKSFPTYLLPLKPKDDEKSKANQPNKSRAEATDFWEMLLKLDATSAKKGKSIVSKSHSNLSSTSESETLVLNFDQSAFGQLLVMLSSPVIYRSMPLTDNLLKLLSIITVGMPELVKETGTHKSKLLKLKYESVPAPESAINLAVNVLTYKSCSEEGLEYITTLLLNMANSSLEMSLVILTLLLKAAIRIGETVRQQIDNMLLELHRLNEQRRELASDEPSTSNMKGVLSNRFTNELVVITASAKVKTSCDLQLPSMAPLTSKTSSQVFFLRVLRVIVQIREAIKKKVLQKKEDKATGAVKKESASKKESKLYMESGLKNHYYSCDDEGMIYLNGLSEQLLALDKLWETLSGCLLELEHTPDHHAVLVLQPAVEAFFLVHSPQHGPMLPEKQATATETPAPGQPEAAATSKDPLDAEPAASSSSTSHDQTTGDNSRTNIPPEHLKFLTFAEKHRTVLNQILRQTTTHLADGTFSVLVDHTRVLDFDVKRKYFRTELDRLDQGIRREETAVHVRRSHIFEDSFRELYRRTPEEWKNRFYIVFEDEEGQDAGGLLREWYVIISRDIFNPMYALFTVSPGDRVTYMINSASHYNSNHLCYYKFVGRVIAKAIYDNKLLECYFTRSFYKHILGIRVKYTDMESEDYSFYRGLVYLMENNINNLGLDLTFSTEINEFGVTETRDLIPNGRNVPVTEDNKMEYVRLSCQMKMTGAIRQQLNAFLEGFYDIIPMRLISIFNEQELELLISGLPNVDIEDLRVNTEYHKYQANSLQIQWFWRALRSFDQAERAKFLQFVTGTSKVPLQGFGALEGMNGVQKFQIHRDDRSTDRLPSAHTCFNQLDLPVYETYDKLRSYLLKAIHECSEGFGFA